MKVLIIGSGGREHALAWKIRQSPRVSQIFCAPGNAGTAEVGENVALLDWSKLADFAQENGIDLTVVGPDNALADGVVDLFQRRGLRIFGPTKAAARLESSKVFAKDFMERHGIPTAKSWRFQESAEAHACCQRLVYPVVIKADGLALGKGVIIAENPRVAAMAINRLMDRREFGAAGDEVVIEEFLQGEECSIHALVDGTNYLLFPAAQDHKRALDGDLGPNTGGMGTSSPVPALTAEIWQTIREKILDRFMAGLHADGLDFRGVLFPGLILTADGPKVLEFNCRFGDPETQVLLPLLQSDLVELLEATIDGTLGQMHPQWNEQAAVCVVLASGGYPGKYQTGLPISGLAEAKNAGAAIFQAGVVMADGVSRTSGGRVLGVVALADGIGSARSKAYAAASEINFSGQHFRRDIGSRAVGVLKVLLLSLALFSPAFAVNNPVLEKLSAEQTNAAIDKIKASPLPGRNIDAADLQRATLQGLLERAGSSARLVALDQTAPATPPEIFRSEMLPRSVEYLRLGDLTAANLTSLSAALLKQPLPAAVILDLRATRADAAYELAAQLTGFFAPSGKPFFQLQKAGSETRDFSGSQPPIFQGLLVVLVNRDCSGPAETVAACLHQDAHAVLAGTATAGRALEFERFPLGPQTALEVAVGQIKLPDSALDLARGLTPDLLVAAKLEDERKILGSSTQEGIAKYIFEVERPHLNEASLVANRNPEIDLYQERLARGDKPEVEPLLDRTLQRALDALTTVLISRLPTSGG